MAQLKGIAINNFRVFKAHTQFDFAPITILTGPNSSGKSSLFKALLMLADSAKKYRLTELDFTGEGHYLGNFEDVLNSESGSDTLTFDLTFTGEKDILFGMLEEGFSLRLEYKKGELVSFVLYAETFPRQWEYIYTIINTEYPDKYLQQFNHPLVSQAYDKWIDERKITTLSLIEQQIIEQEEADKFGKIEGLFINKSYLFNLLSSFDIDSVKSFLKRVEHEVACIYILNQSSFPLINEYMIDERMEERIFDIDINNMDKDIIKEEPYFGGFIDESEIEFLYVPTLSELFSESFLEEYNDYFKVIGDIQAYQILTERFHIYESLIVKDMSKIKELIINSIDSLQRNAYLEAIRANVKRLYAYQSQGTSINFTLLELSRLLSSEKQSSPIHSFLKNSVQRFGIGDDLKIKNIEGAANKITLLRKEHEINLADLGYGFTQFLAIPLKLITTLDLKKVIMPHTRQENGLINIGHKFYMNPVDGYFYVKRYFFSQTDNGIVMESDGKPPERLEKYHFPAVNGPLFLLEEPETNLHPKLQSMLADFFVEACRTFEMTLVAETHSEYLVRKLQYLVSKGEIRPQDVVIYYFYPPAEVPEGRNQVERINIQSDGRLDNEFGSGFFDESAKLMMSLLTGEALN
jgi:AAA15 family ATPase/GTPase